MTAKVQVVRAVSPSFDEESGVVSADEDMAEVVYEGRGRVYTVSGPVTYSLGDQNQYMSASYVSVPVTVTSRVNGAEVVEVVRPRNDDLVLVLEHDDPVMVGRWFRVMDVEAGGQWIAARRMQVVGVQWSRHWQRTVDPEMRVERHLPPKEWQL